MTLTFCPTLDDYRQAFAELDARGVEFIKNQSVPIAKVNYIKQEGFFFARISEQEYNQLNNGSDE